MLVFENTPVPFARGLAYASLSVEPCDDGLNVRYELRAGNGARYVMTAQSVDEDQVEGLIATTLEDWSNESAEG